MAVLAETKKQIQATKNTQKITQAMELVAANKMKLFQKQAIASRRYALSLVQNLALCGTSLTDLSYTQAPKSAQKSLFIFITSDKGLCGALNMRMTETLFNSKQWTGTSAENRVLFTIGRKGYESALQHGYSVSEHFPEITEKTDSFETLQLIDHLLARWNEGDLKEIFLVSTHYINPFTTEPTIKPYLPLTPEMAREHLYRDVEEPSSAKKEARIDQHIVFEPTAERVIDVLVRQLMHMLFLQAFIEFKASEYSSRMVAMKKATEAAEDVVKQLTLDYNKGRQSAITQQLCELAAGSDAVEEEVVAPF